jgi:hypothetical protein
MLLLSQTPPRVGVIAYCPAPEPQYQPSFAVTTLQNGYDCVVAITDLGCGIPMPDAIANTAANTLAAYANGGRGLVLTPFSFAQPRPSLGLGSAVFTPGLSPLEGTSIYNSFLSGAFNTSSMSALPACSKITQGVTGSFGSGLANDTALAAGGTLCVGYTSGMPAVAVNTTGRVVGFNSFPSDQAAQAQAGYRKLFANSVYQACTGTAEAPSLTVPFDVKPASCPNAWNPGSKGLLPAAILGTAEVPVNRIDPASIRLAGVAPVHFSIADVGTPYAPFSGKSSCQACNAAKGDGLPDLELKFDSEAIAARLPGGTRDACVVLTVTARLKPEFGGAEIHGEDVVSVK